MTAIQQSFLALGTTRLECKTITLDPHWPTMVFLHEGLGSVAMWRDFPERVCEAVRCNGFVYSRLGYGASSPLVGRRPVDFMEREAAEVLPAILDAARIEQPILFGHSDGGSIALLFAAAFPDSLRAAIVLAPHLFVEDVAISAITATRDSYPKLRDRLARYHDDVDGAFRGWQEVWLDPSFHAWNIEASLARIRCPLLAIQGEGDEYGTMVQIDRIARHVPGSRLVKIAHCGHSPHRDQPEQVIEAVRALMTTLS